MITVTHTHTFPSHIPPPVMSQWRQRLETSFSCHLNKSWDWNMADPGAEPAPVRAPQADRQVQVRCPARGRWDEMDGCCGAGRHRTWDRPVRRHLRPLNRVTGGEIKKTSVFSVPSWSHLEFKGLTSTSKQWNKSLQNPNTCTNVDMLQLHKRKISKASFGVKNAGDYGGRKVTSVSINDK